MTYREVTRRLVALGCEERVRRGRGHTGSRFNPRSQRGTVVPDWGSRDLKTGTIRNVVSQLGLDWQDFVNA